MILILILGSQTLQVSCLRQQVLKGVTQKEQTVSDYYCSSSDKPIVVTRRCNIEKCPARFEKCSLLYTAQQTFDSLYYYWIYFIQFNFQ